MAEDNDDNTIRTQVGLEVDAPDGVSNDNTPTISGRTDAGSGAEVRLTVTDAAGRVHNVTATVDANGEYSVEVPALADDDYTVVAEVSDRAGNIARASDSGVIDTSAAIIVNVPALSNDNTPTISGTYWAAQLPHLPRRFSRRPRCGYAQNLQRYPG